jgi:predicted metal-binding membrane protein
MIGTLAGGKSLPPAIPLAIGVSWAIIVAAQVIGAAEIVHHDGLIGAGLPLSMALILFALSWQTMVVAMMLPTSLPMIRLFRMTSGSQPAQGRVLTAFLSGYALVWMGFGFAALGGDMLLHRFEESSGWLSARPWLLPASALALAGLFQFTKLKDRCLSECRHPGPFLMRHYRRGPGAALELGVRHGLFCLGCCWALMLLMFAVGVANLTWMAVLTALMVYEKTGQLGEWVARYAGATFLVMAVVVWLSGSGF